MVWQTCGSLLKKLTWLKSARPPAPPNGHPENAFPPATKLRQAPFPHATSQMTRELEPPVEGVLFEILQCDPRPTFVVEISKSTSPSEPPGVAFANAPLTRDDVLYNAVLEVVGTRDSQFWRWVGGDRHENHHNSVSASSMLFLDQVWTRSLFRGRWAIISSNEQRLYAISEPEQQVRGHTILQAELPPDVIPSVGTRDSFTVPDLSREQEEPFVLIINNFDWASTPLGPMPQWPIRLRHTFNQVLSDSRPIVIYWGPAHTILYNEAFSRLCGVQHPSLLGKPVEDIWPEFYRRLIKAAKRVPSDRHASEEEDWVFFVETADGRLEEKYLEWSIVPIMSETENQYAGFLQPMHDATSMRMWERRMKMLISIGNAIVTARDVKSYWTKILQALENCEPSYDIPLAILYSVVDSTDPSSISNSPYDCNIVCTLEGSLGVPEHHPLAPQELNLCQSQDGLSSIFREVLRANKPTVIDTKDGTLPEALLKGIHWRGFKDPCNQAIICPIRPTREENVMGLLVLGLNPRRPYDGHYQQYVSLLNQKLATTLASTVLLEEEARRRRNIVQQAAYDRAILKEKLAVQTKEANEWVGKFQAIAEFIPIGMCFGDSEGNITFANDAWHLITGLPKSEPISHEAFLSQIVKEDRQSVSRAYTATQTLGSATVEFRVPRDEGDDNPLQAPIGSSPAFEKAGLDLTATKERHILAAMKAETAPDGTILRVLACLTDVTLHRRVAEEATRRAQQAENLKKMADSATVGMYEMRSDGSLLWANNSFFEICGLEKFESSRASVKPFETCIIEEDMPFLHQTLDELVFKGGSKSVELRFKTTWIEEDSAGNKIVVPRCILAIFMPVMNTGGEIETFTGCLVDMSLQRWQYDNERKRKDEAIESKRQQENFIDMTSHEMRNPLSAIVQCADSIVASCSKVHELLQYSTDSLSSALSTEVKELSQTCIDNAETIDICAQHQRHIVDDILTMSKMDSDLLAITPTTVDPRLVAKETLKMFEVEARRVDIDLSMTVDPSYFDLQIEYLDFDPSRLRQILINLLTNALKFTKSQATRHVSITLSASHDRPSDTTSSVQYIPRTTETIPQSSTEGDLMFLTFEVTDTGQGLTEEEKSSLFQRFVQASPKTHVKYGGSGLGLFITKRLTEMLGGKIGVASRPGYGSTFAFYIATQIPGEAALEEARALTKNAQDTALHTPTSTTTEKLGLAGSPRTAVVDAPQLDNIIGVLIVEDNLINQQITRRGLLDKGYKVDVANHGLEALDKLKQTNRQGGEFPLDVIMMDMEMPIQDGLTCTRNIREMEKEGKLKGPRIPIIAVSANARAEQIQEAKAAGCDDVLVKPYKIPELIKIMQKTARRLIAAEMEKAQASQN
ncbi:hsp90-like protein [Xylariales sp. PMI_506]|nr:hsp90-like protein [Xylariales sp. PMI_506]